MVQQSNDSHNPLSKLLESGSYSDLLIRCGDAGFRVHKCIVCPQSSFFRNACEKGRWKEGESGIIELKAFSDECPDVADDDPRAVKLMIDYLYLGDYDPATAHEYESPSTIEERIVLASPEPDAETAFAEPDIDGTFASSLEPVELSDAISADPVADSWGGLPVVPGPVNSSFLEMHAKMFVIASKYDITPLRDEASKKLKHETKLDWQGPDLIAAMSIIFSQTPEKRAKLRNVFKGVIVKHARTLVEVSGFQEAVADIEGLAYDLFLRQTKSIG